MVAKIRNRIAYALFIIICGKGDHDLPIKNSLRRFASQTHTLGREQKRKVQGRQQQSECARNPAVPNNRLIPGSIWFSEAQEKSKNRK